MMMMEKDNLDDFIRAKKRLRVHLYYIHFWCKQGKIELHRSFFFIIIYYKQMYSTKYAKTSVRELFIRLNE